MQTRGDVIVHLQPAAGYVDGLERNGIDVLKRSTGIGSQSLPRVDFALDAEGIGDAPAAIARNAPDVGHHARRRHDRAKLADDARHADFKLAHAFEPDLFFWSGAPTEPELHIRPAVVFAQRFIV